MKLDGMKVLVCAGSGGVGKTTMSAALGLALAEQGQRVMVLTIDPAKRLAQALGIQNHLEEVKVPHGSGRLSAGVIEPEVIFDRFVRESCTTPEAAERLLKNRLYRQLSRSLSGSQEFTALERLLTVYESGQYDVILLDTPPAEHALDFLRAPNRIYSLFQESVTKWFVRPEEEAPLWQRLMNRGTQTVLNALERVTGASFIRELADFFQSMAALQLRVSERSRKVHELLTGRQTGFILVTGFDQVKLTEAEEFLSELKSSGYDLKGVLVNRAFPEWLDLDNGWNEGQNKDESKLLDYYQQWREFLKERITAYDQFASRLNNVPVFRIVDMQEEVFGLDALERMAKELNKQGII